MALSLLHLFMAILNRTVLCIDTVNSSSTDNNYSFIRQNILLDSHLSGKLADFGFARELPTCVNDRSMVSVELLVKSAGYAAPELDACRHSPKTDVYAYGVVSSRIIY